MSFRSWKDRVPKKQSLKDPYVEDIQTQEKNLILGPVGSSPTATHLSGKTAPDGKPPRKMHDRELRELVNRDASR